MKDEEIRELMIKLNDSAYSRIDMGLQSNEEWYNFNLFNNALEELKYSAFLQELLDKRKEVEDVNKQNTQLIQTNVSQANELTELREALENIEKVLDEYLGDTDPSMDDTWTDEDIKTEYPILWCCMQINKQLAKEEG